MGNDAAAFIYVAYLAIYALIFSGTRFNTIHQAILIGLGGNLSAPGFGSPLAGLRAALDRLSEHGIRTLRLSDWYRSAPVPPSDQPWFVNGVAAVATDLPPPALLARMLAVEVSLGRQRLSDTTARTVDLDLLAYGDMVGDWTASADLPSVSLPHPRLAERAFVLVPLADVAPDWRHPVSRRSVREMLAALPDRADIEPLSP